MIEINEGKAIQFNYLNWKGEYGIRRVVHMTIHYGSTEYHPEKQWLMEAYELDKQEVRIFAMKDMSNIRFIDQYL